MKRLFLLAALLLAASGALFAQGVAYSNVTEVQGQGNVVRVVPSAAVVVCNFPGTGGTPCTNLATTYTSPTLGTSCSLSTQFVAPGSSSCSATSDLAGNFGFYVPGGTYVYYFQTTTGWQGPFTTVLPSTSSPLTAKGDIFTYSSTNVRFPIGADGLCLKADSTQTAGLNWASCPSGGGGSPAGNSNDGQINLSGSFAAAGTNLTKMGNVNGVKYASSYNWTQSPGTPASITLGANTITLTPCPQGFFVNFADYTPTQYVYIAGTGTAEADLATRVSGHAGDASCQFSVTARNVHSAGYTVGSASGGIKEASEAARASIGYNFQQGGQVQIDFAGSPFAVYAPLHLEASFQRVYYGGGRIECYVSAANGAPADDDCIVVGSRASALTTRDVTLDGLVIHPHNGNTANYAFDGIHVNAQSTFIHYPHFNYGASAGTQPGTGSFNAYVSVCDDESFTFDGFYVLDGYGMRTDHQGQAIYALAEGASRNVNNCFAVGSIMHANLNMQCTGSGITWLSGNGLSVSDSQIQGFVKWGISAGTPTGGFNGQLVSTNNYFEIGSCNNPDYVAAGSTVAAGRAQVGILMQGSRATVNGSTGPVGQTPTFVCSGSAGSNTLNYWVVATQAGAATGNGSSTPLYAGRTSATCSGTVTGFFPSILPLSPGTMTYDVLRTCGSSGASIAIPYRGGTPGGAVCAGGSVVVGQADAGGAVQTFTDASATANTTAYTVPQISFVPYLAQWPGNVVLSAQGPSNRTNIPVAMLIGDANMSGGNSAGVVSVNGPYSPSYFSTSAGNNTTGPLMTGSVPVQLGGFGQATILMRAQQANADVANTKGRLNFMSNNLALYNAGSSIITLADSNPDKTIGTPGNRPVMDATDGYIANDNTGNVANTAVPISFGSAISLSNYINSLPDGSSWLERLTSSLKTFKVPITTNSQVTSTLATGTPPIVAASTTPVANLTLSNHPLLQDCGATTTCANTQKTAPLLVIGRVSFPTATTVTVTALPFTSSTSYTCIAQDVTTAAGVINATTYTSGSSVTFTETGGVNTDGMRYQCSGF